MDFVSLPSRETTPGKCVLHPRKKRKFRPAPLFQCWPVARRTEEPNQTNIGDTGGGGKLRPELPFFTGGFAQAAMRMVSLGPLPPGHPIARGLLRFPCPGRALDMAAVEASGSSSSSSSSSSSGGSAIVPPSSCFCSTPPR